MAHSKQEVVDHINGVLIDLFEIEEEKLVPEALLHDDLDIDSIDTIDLLIELKKFVPQEIDADKFIDAKTLGDVADIVHQFSSET
ncbi:hypothetical protein NBRC116583_07340 [Arenicella sp. 4NH20-0111]|uniref:acyl carrier protein n=1 Tax=Arenicella sp. 4NH20-0111 TaxID=3127648 RepID=UPI0031060344